jgi:exodeoxyribonuclease VII large subunit
MTKYLKISELCENIKLNLPPSNFNIHGEVSNVKLSNGHVYFIIKEKGYMMNGIIWKSALGDHKISDGDSLKLMGHINFYNPGGSINFVVSKIVEICGLGILYQEYEKRKLEYKLKGYFEKDRKNEDLIKKICLITSKEGAAIHDFLYVINSSKQRIDVDIKDVTVQGANCEKMVSNAINQLDNIYDLVVITRGGGSFEDLFKFSDPLIIESVYSSSNIVLSAIGHQVDTTLCDFSADISCPTPSLAGEYIVNHNLKLITKIENLLGDKKEMLCDRLNDLEKMIINQENKLISPVKQMDDKLNDIKMQIQKRIDNYEFELEKMKDKLNSSSQLRMIQDGQVMTSLREFKNCENNTFKLQFPDGEIEVKIIIQ